MISARGMMKSLLARTGVGERLFRSYLKRSGNRVIFLFHRVLPQQQGNDLSPAGMVAGVESFRRFLDWLPERFELPPPRRFLEGWPEPPKKAEALITFDDGWADVVRYGLPEMSRRGIGAIMFLSTRFVDTGELFWPERLIALLGIVGDARFREVTGALPPRRDDAAAVETMLTLWKARTEKEREEMLAALAPAGDGGETHRRRIATWDDVRRLKEGGFEIGSHGMNHTLLASIPEEEARRELISSRERIAAVLGESPSAIAYPNGDRNSRVRELAEEAGYSFGFSLKGNWSDRFDLPRINLHEESIATAGRIVWTIGRST